MFQLWVLPHSASRRVISSPSSALEFAKSPTASAIRTNIDASPHPLESSRVLEMSATFRSLQASTVSRDVCDRVCEIPAHKGAWESHIRSMPPNVPMVSSEAAESLVESMLSETREAYASSVSRTMVEYRLKSPRTCSVEGIDPDLLRDPASSWTSGEYGTYAWRVLRETGVSSKSVRAAKVAISDNLVLSSASLDAQSLWIDRKIASCLIMALSPHDVYPSTAAFSKYVESTTDAAQANLRDAWLSSVATIVANVCDNSPESDDRVKLVTSISVLMSRQLRGAVDASLQTFEESVRSIVDEKKSLFAARIQAPKPNEGPFTVSSSLDVIAQTLCSALDKVVKSASQIPRIDGSGYIGP